MVCFLLEVWRGQLRYHGIDDLCDVLNCAVLSGDVLIMVMCEVMLSVCNAFMHKF